ncbi:hypothetical protein MHEL_50820 [Mycolicibacterium helvum]|uniref:Uncharacterized protein n=1 Tax=Mycolicibacterium helvum TaxID=1534349 RepID=A0A7I7TEH9_9MYCO|nr:hypothetical protein MHEL_50820 [Mycolicibacterium helvum]
MSWQMQAIATYGRLIRRPRTYATPQSARAYLNRPKSASGPPSQLATSARHQVTRDDIDGFDCYTVHSSNSETIAADLYTGSRRNTALKKRSTCLAK